MILDKSFRGNACGELAVMDIERFDTEYCMSISNMQGESHIYFSYDTIRDMKKFLVTRKKVIK